MKIKFVPQDLWVGLYWKTETLFDESVCKPGWEYTKTTWYLCVIPCFPVIWSTKQFTPAF